MNCSQDAAKITTTREDRCTSPKILLLGSIVSHTDLPPNALSRLNLDSRSCTADSFYALQSHWSIRDFSYVEQSGEYRDGKEPVHTSQVSFKIRNSDITDLQFRCEDWTRLQPADQHRCPLDLFDPAWRQTLETENEDISILYSFDKRRNLLTLSMTWVCSDLDPAHPYV